MTNETNSAVSPSGGPPKYKRRKKLINKSLQLKLVGVFTAIGSTCALFQIVLVNYGLLEIAKSAPGGGNEILEKARGMMLTNVAWTLGALVPLMTCIGIVLTHRIAGPAYRMTQHCKEIAAGGAIRTCKIRKDDELQELCDALNAAIETMSGAKDAGEEVAAQAEQPAEAASDENGEKDESQNWDLEDTPSVVRNAKGEEMPHESEPSA